MSTHTKATAIASSKIAVMQQESHREHEEVAAADKTTFGFWIYLMTDCVLFATLFATYAVLHTHTFGGPDGRELFSLPYILIETFLLLTSSYTCGLAMLAVHKNRPRRALLAFKATWLLGAAFLAMELYEFRHLVQEGHSWKASAFLSSYFTLVGTHGLHITIGLLWMLVMMVRVWKYGLTPGSMKRLTMLSLFWHFLDIVWIFIFTIVYMMRAI